MSVPTVETGTGPSLVGRPWERQFLQSPHSLSFITHMSSAVGSQDGYMWLPTHCLAACAQITQEVISTCSSSGSFKLMTSICCMYMYGSEYMCIHVCAHTHGRAWGIIHLCSHVCVYMGECVCMCVHKYVGKWVCTHMCEGEYMCVHTCVCINVCTRVWRPAVTSVFFFSDLLP